MEEIFLNTTPQNNPKMQRIQQALFFLIGFLALSQELFQLSKGWYPVVHLFFGIFCIVVAIFWHQINRSKEYLFSSEGVEGPLNTNRSRKILWSEISLIKFNLYSMEFKLKDGYTFKLNLHNLTFEQHNRVKPKIVELIRSKGIEIDAA